MADREEAVYLAKLAEQVRFAACNEMERASDDGALETQEHDDRCRKSGAVRSCCLRRRRRRRERLSRLC